MLDWIFGKRKDELEEIYFPDIKPTYPLFHPMPPKYSEPFIRDKIHKMLLACLTGGMAYSDAKEACIQEFGDELAAAKESDERAKVAYKAMVEEYQLEFKRYLEEKNNGKND